MNTESTSTYEGWANRATWNVSLFINNTQNYYKAAVYFMTRRKNTGVPVDGAYQAFIQSAGLANAQTSDGYRYLSNELDYAELDDMMSELID